MQGTGDPPGGGAFIGGVFAGGGGCGAAFTGKTSLALGAQPAMGAWLALGAPALGTQALGTQAPLPAAAPLAAAPLAAVPLAAAPLLAAPVAEKSRSSAHQAHSLSPGTDHFTSFFAWLMLHVPS